MVHVDKKVGRDGGLAQIGSERLSTSLPSAKRLLERPTFEAYHSSKEVSS